MFISLFSSLRLPFLFFQERNQTSAVLRIQTTVVLSRTRRQTRLTGPGGGCRHHHRGQDPIRIIRVTTIKVTSAISLCPILSYPILCMGGPIKWDDKGNVISLIIYLFYIEGLSNEAILKFLTWPTDHYTVHLHRQCSNLGDEDTTINQNKPERGTIPF